MDHEENLVEALMITNNLHITYWCEAFEDFIHRTRGFRNAPLLYVRRNVINVSVVVPVLIHHKPHSEDHCSVGGKIIA